MVEATDPRDEELVRYVQERNCRRSLQILVLRYMPRIQAWIVGQGKGKHLRPEDIGDAQQDAFFVLVKAICSFHACPDESRPCRFSTYLFRRVSDRFRDYTRKVRRFRVRNVAFTARRRAGVQEPICTLEQDEMKQRVEKTLQTVARRARWVWEQHCEGKPLSVLAHELGVPYRAACDQWHDVKATLARTLKDWA
jgi:RNA polymerase sigma factor (sigma-70 family)